MLRRTFFWLHLAAGLIAGLVIGIMCFTGVTLAFEKQLVAWSERDARVVPLPPAPASDAPRLPLAELTRRVRAAEPEARPASVVVSADPRQAVAFSLGRDRTVYANPYTGEVRTPASTRVHDFMHVMEDWHRTLALSGDQRPLGKAINGACNLAFLFLAVSGLYLWWPRTWSWRGVKAIAVLNLRGATGRARDFNWHNAIGLWCAPVLIVLTLTAIPISYHWGGNLITLLAGETPSARPAPSPPPAPAATGAHPLDQDAVLARVQRDFPRWELITFRAAGARGGSQSPSVSIRESDSWPRTATTTLTLDAVTGDVLKREGYADLPASRRIRAWTRFLHTGEALGPVGQLLAGLACPGGCFLVYTGFALSWRRFFSKRSAPTPSR